MGDDRSIIVRVGISRSRPESPRLHSRWSRLRYQDLLLWELAAQAPDQEPQSPDAATRFDRRDAYDRDLAWVERGNRGAGGTIAGKTPRRQSVFAEQLGQHRTRRLVERACPRHAQDCCRAAPMRRG